MLECENRTLLKRISELTEQLAVETNRDRQLALSMELKVLQSRVNQQNRELFGSKSEKRPQPGRQARKAREKRKKRTGSARTKQPELPLETVRHELDEADRVCPKCGGRLHEKNGRLECSERIKVTERIYTVVRDEKQVYGCGGCGHSEAALPPKQLVPGGRYDSSVAINVAVDKYVDHQPLNRQVRTMSRAGLIVTRQSLCDQLYALAEVCEPSYEALHDWMVRAHDVLHADETTWRMMLDGGSTKWWLWAIAAEDGFFCMSMPSRSADAARLILRDFSGALMTDAYSAYGQLAKEGEQDILSLDGEQRWHPRFTSHICWSHARRRFEQASKYEDDAHTVLDYVAELYEVEARAKELAAGNTEKLFETRGDLRASESRAIIDKIGRWRAKQRALPGSKMDEGLSFLKNQWAGLIRFLENPKVELDNNFAERQIRPVVLGRKNHLGSHSEHGAAVSAMFYSLLGTCRLVGTSPHRYLTTLVARALDTPGYALLPHEFAAEATPT